MYTVVFRVAIKSLDDKYSEHLVAQELVKTMWYKSYKIQTVEIKHEYSSNI